MYFDGGLLLWGWRLQQISDFSQFPGPTDRFSFGQTPAQDWYLQVFCRILLKILLIRFFHYTVKPLYTSKGNEFMESVRSLFYLLLSLVSKTRNNTSNITFTTAIFSLSLIEVFSREIFNRDLEEVSFIRRCPLRTVRYVEVFS